MSSNFAEFKQHEYTQDEVRAALKQSGLVSGTAAIVHASLFALGHMVDDNGDFAQTWIDLLLEAVGPDGAIILPAFTYSYCEGKVYDPHKSLSTVSLLANQAIVTHQGYRTLDPIFSYVILPGSEAVAKKVAAYQFSNVCFDMDNSIVGLARSISDNPVICEPKANDEFSSFTVIHFAEQKVHRETRFMKVFKGTTIINGAPQQTECHYFCRVLIPNTEIDFSRLDLSANKVSLGYGGIESYQLNAYLEGCCKAISLDSWVWLKGPALSSEELRKYIDNEHVEEEGSICRCFYLPVKL